MSSAALAADTKSPTTTGFEIKTLGEPTIYVDVPHKQNMTVGDVLRYLSEDDLVRYRYMYQQKDAAEAFETKIDAQKCNFMLRVWSCNPNDGEKTKKLRQKIKNSSIVTPIANAA